MQKYNSPFHLTVALSVILAIAYVSNFLNVESKLINRGLLTAPRGNPYKEFLAEMNLPSKTGALLVVGTPDNLVKMEIPFKNDSMGEFFTYQLGSLLGIEITQFSQAAYINYVFGSAAILFSLLAGQLIFTNAYSAVILFIPIVIFKNFSSGLIYGLPNKYSFSTFNPFLTFCLIITIISYLENQAKKYLPLFIFSGLILGYLEFCRSSEGMIIKATIILFMAVMCLVSLKKHGITSGLKTRLHAYTSSSGKNKSMLASNKSVAATQKLNKFDYKTYFSDHFKKTFLGLFLAFSAFLAGYLGFYKIISAIEFHRDEKLGFIKNDVVSKQGHPAFHNLYISLFRFDKSIRYGDRTGYDTVLKNYPELKARYGNDYQELVWSDEYHIIIEKLYIEYILNHPGDFFEYLYKSVYDYFLFLPYYSWSGTKSAHAYLPKINLNAIIDWDDLAPDYRDSDLSWILNLKPEYLPQDMLFKIYFALAYLLLAEAVYTAFAWTEKNAVTTTSRGVSDSALPIYLLRGMLIYFFFASVVRILIPNYGHSAVVAFNVIVIYNLARIAASTTLTMEIPQIKISFLPLLLGILFVSLLTLKGLSWKQEYRGSLVANGGFEDNTNGWIAHRSILHAEEGGQSGQALKIAKAFGSDPTHASYAYQAFPTRPGSLYLLTAYFKRGANQKDGQIKVGNMINTENLFNSGPIYNTDWTSYVGFFKASAPISYVTLLNNSSIEGESSYFDSIIISELNE